MTRHHAILSGGLLLSCGLVGFVLAGLESIEPGEVGVVRRLGRLRPEPLEPGLHWMWPLGIDRIETAQRNAVRRLRVGWSGPATARRRPGAGEFLTGDLNLLTAEAVVAYRVAAPAAFLLTAERPEALLAPLAEAAFARSCARRPIDDVLRADRRALEDEATAALQAAVDDLGLGLSILGFNLVEARPPREVRAAFAEAQAASTHRERRLREAEGRAERLRTEAAAEAEARLDRAEAQADRRIRGSRAEAERFRALAAELKEDRALTVSRLFSDRMRALWANVGRTVVLPAGAPIDLSLWGLPEASNGRESPRSINGDSSEAMRGDDAP